MNVRTLFAPDHGQPHAVSRYTALDEAVLDVGETLHLSRFPEQRLYVFTDGRGFMNIYPATSTRSGKRPPSGRLQ